MSDFPPELPQVLRLNKRNIELIPTPVKRLEYRDEDNNAFRLRVAPSGRKVFYLLKRHNSKLMRVKLGAYPDITPDQARKKAAHTLSEIAHDESPNEKKKANHAAGVTLQQALDTYLEKNKKLKPSSRYQYEKKITLVFASYLDKPLAALKREQVFKIHAEYAKQSPAGADAAMRYLRAIFNFAAGEYLDQDGASLFPDNPTKELSRLKAWGKPTRRRSLIRKHQMPHWFSAVQDLPNLYPTEQAPIVRDLFLTLLFSGLRRNEAARLMVGDVDLAARIILVRETKNSEPHELPIGEYLASVLERRKAAAVNGYLFPDRNGKGAIKTFTKAHNAVKESSGVEFIPHDLRRTFITIAEAQNMSRYTLKRLLNHAEGDDVTGGYIVLDTERLREPMELIESQILKLAGIAPSADVVAISRGANNGTQ